MSAVKLVRMISAAAAAAGLATYVRYRRDIAEARSRLERGSRIAATSAGDVEYAEAGTGEPLLLVHGAGGGYDQGLLIGRDLGEGFRIIAPSRFGYLRTPVPTDSSPAAQAEAHAALLDSLRLEKCIVAGVSAGAPSAIEFALRFPRRTTALLLMVPRTYDPTRSIGPDKGLGSRVVLTLIEASADFLFWIAIQVARPTIVRFLGVPRSSRPARRSRSVSGSPQSCGASFRFRSGSGASRSTMRRISRPGRSSALRRQPSSSPQGTICSAPFLERASRPGRSAARSWRYSIAAGT